MSDDALVICLQKLGLNLYESRAYLALLLRRQLSAKDLGQMTTIPQSRTYDVLESLKDKGFALTTPSSPKLYTPVEPDRVLSSYYGIKKKEVQAQVLKVQEEAEVKLGALQEAYSTLIKELPSLQREGLSVPEPVWVIEGRENIENTMTSLIQKAKKEFFRITRPPDPRSKYPFDPFYFVGIERRKHIYDALERGVQMHWLSIAREVPTFLGSEVEEQPVRRYLEKDEEIPEKFVLVDGKTVLLNLRDPVSQTFGSIALLIESELTYKIFREHFEAMWGRAKPIADLLDHVKELVQKLALNMKTAGFSPAEIMVFKTLAHIGAMRPEAIFEELRERKIPPAEISAGLGRLIKAGYVHHNDGLKLYMAEHPERIMNMSE